MDWQSILDGVGVFATKFFVLMGIVGFAAVVVYSLESLSDRVRSGRRRQRI
ncbi:MAG: hypothetical protein ACM30I_08075 [Gemmatimonas sp.]